MPEAKALAEEWETDFRRHSLLEDGDPEGLIEHLRDLAETAGPGSTAQRAFAIFLERLRDQDLDPVLDDDGDYLEEEVAPGGLT
jgi:hypothetical protein